jgi:hypothetical protein
MKQLAHGLDTFVTCGVPFSVARICPGRLKLLDALISMNLIQRSACPSRDGGKLITGQIIGPASACQLVA